jgi:hypothetical protein
MSEAVSPGSTAALAAMRRKLLPEMHDVFAAFSERVATPDEIMEEAIWLAAEMRAGGVYAHSAIALDASDRISSPK